MCVSVLRATQDHWQGLNGSDVHFLRTPLSAMALLRVKHEAWRRPGKSQWALVPGRWQKRLVLGCLEVRVRGHSVGSVLGS